MVPVEHAVALGASQVTAIVLEPPGARVVEGEFGRIPAVLLRALSLMITEICEDDIPAGVNLTVIRPKEPLTDNSLRFDPAEMREMMRKGYEAAQDAIP